MIHAACKRARWPLAGQAAAEQVRRALATARPYAAAPAHSASGRPKAVRSGRVGCAGRGPADPDSDPDQILHFCYSFERARGAGADV